MSKLPIIMAAPNGARKTKADHPSLPMTIAETVAEASQCFEAGASILHAHIRDDDGKHSLDSNTYDKLLNEMAVSVPEMLVQITTEAAGIFTPQQQATCLFEVQPQFASIGVREMTGSGEAADLAFAADIYSRVKAQGTSIQHIVYSPDDLAYLITLKQHKVIPDGRLHALFVLGRYNPGFVSDPSELDGFLTDNINKLDSWMLCAFGASEYDSIIKAISHGGHGRIGFENNIYLKDGSLAPNTASLIAQIADTQSIAKGEDTRSTLT
ncbi:MAG: 3-keto-5-aminohexanoate cleavage protein [Alphaproteobacteria bacterium]|nr:3-keto-5-aminohexanoate cleavage protein [Alphaproteobacteria bacterium]